MVTKCGCLDEAKKAVLSDVLDTHANILEDKAQSAVLLGIKQEIQECICAINSSKSTKQTSTDKRKLSAYNIHTSKCMKGGESMSNCAIHWNEQKKLKNKR